MIAMEEGAYSVQYPVFGLLLKKCVSNACIVLVQ